MQQNSKQSDADKTSTFQPKFRHGHILIEENPMQMDFQLKFRRGLGK